MTLLHKNSSTLHKILRPGLAKSPPPPPSAKALQQLPEWYNPVSPVSSRQPMLVGEIACSESYAHVQKGPNPIPLLENGAPITKSKEVVFIAQRLATLSSWLDSQRGF